MSRYSQAAFTPLTVGSPVLPAHSAATRELTLSFEDSRPGSPRSRIRSPPPPAQSNIPDPTPQSRYPIPDDIESGTSSKSLNELMKDIKVLAEVVHVHKRRFNRLMSCVLWLHKTLLNLDGYEPQWATWIGRLDLFIRHLHRKLREWHRLGFVSCVAWADTICEDITSMQRQSEELGISRHRSIMDDLEARALEEDILDKRDLTLALVQIVQTEELKRDAMKLRDTAADNLMNRLLASFDNTPTPANQLVDLPDNYMTLATSLLHAMSLAVLSLPSSLILGGLEGRSSQQIVNGRTFEIRNVMESGEVRALKMLIRPPQTTSVYSNIISMDLFRRAIHQVLLFLPTHIHHPHVLPTFGVTLQYSVRIPGETEVPALVTPWCGNGSVAEYVVAAGDVLNRLRLAAEIAGALAYLHAKGIVHRSVRCENVLINDAGQTQLTGFSRSYAIDSPSISGTGSGAEDIDSLFSRTTLSIVRQSAVRWTAPWVLTPSTTPNGAEEKNADMWSFAMLLIELLSGNKPLEKTILDEAVAMDLLSIKYAHQFPCQWDDYNKPQYRRHGLINDVWSVVERCWGSTPATTLSEVSMTLERLARDWEFGGREAAFASAREAMDDIAERLDSVPIVDRDGEEDWVHVHRSQSPVAPRSPTSPKAPYVLTYKTPTVKPGGTIYGIPGHPLGQMSMATPRGVPLPMSPAPSKFAYDGFGHSERFGFGSTLGVGAGTYAPSHALGGGTPSRVPLPLSPMMSERPISPFGSRGGYAKTPSAFGLHELRSQTGSPGLPRSSTPWQRPVSPGVRPWSGAASPIPLIVPLSPSEMNAQSTRSRRAYTTTEVRLGNDDARFVAGEMNVGKASLEEEFGVTIEMLHKDEPEGGQWAGRNALWKVTGPENHVDNAIREIMTRIRLRDADQNEVVRIDRDAWVLRQEAIKAALDLLALAYNVTVEISDVQYNMERGEAVIEVTFGGERLATAAAGSELARMIEFHTRFNNAVAIEAPRGLRSRIQHRGRGWLYEIGNSFNVDFELVEEGVVIARGPAPGIEDAKKAFMSHFADVKRKHETIRSHEVWHKLLRKNQKYVYRAVRTELIRLGISIDSESGPVPLPGETGGYVPTRPLPNENDSFSSNGTLWQLRENKEEPGEGISLWRLVGAQDQHAELNAASALLRGAIERATHVAFLTLPEEARKSLDHLAGERVEALSKETGADIRIPKEDELWHCTVIFIGPKLSVEFARDTILEMCRPYLRH